MNVPYAVPELLPFGMDTSTRAFATPRPEPERAVIGAAQFSAADRRAGQGVKVAIVDDGIDENHPSSTRRASRIRPASRRARPGRHAEGHRRPRVPRPGATAAPIDRDHSFHATFVAGVIAGVAARTPRRAPGLRPRGRGRLPSGGQGAVGRRAARLDRELPRLQHPAPVRWLLLGEQPGDRRRLRGGREGRDGHHQLLGWRAAGRPAADILMEAVTNTVRAGVLPVSRRATTATPSASGPPARRRRLRTRSAWPRSRTRTSSASRSVQVAEPFAPMPFAPRTRPDLVEHDGPATDRRRLDRRGDRLLCSAPALPAGSLRGAIALVTRGGCPFSTKASRVAQAGGVGMVVSDDRRRSRRSRSSSARGGRSPISTAPDPRAGAGEHGGVAVRFTAAKRGARRPGQVSRRATRPAGSRRSGTR